MFSLMIPYFLNHDRCPLHLWTFTLVAAVGVADPTEMGTITPSVETNITPHLTMLKVQELLLGILLHGILVLLGGWLVHGELMMLRGWCLHGKPLVLGGGGFIGNCCCWRGGTSMENCWCWG